VPKNLGVYNRGTDPWNEACWRRRLMQARAIGARRLTKSAPPASSQFFGVLIPWIIVELHPPPFLS